ncbi:MAG: FAD-dependent oxidoreductase, partial [Thermodesulfobacteriota bacterium]|nr:FAD-dependent oxidoreductase [Thermodesulfobacteriota bacterium]
TYFNALLECCGQVPFFNLDLELTPFLQGLFRPQPISLGDFLSRNIKSRELQAVLAAPAFLHGISPKNIGMTMHAVVAHSYYCGAYGIRGGGRAIADAFCDLLYREGVEILTNQRADSIRAEGGQTSGVITTDCDITANHVIYTGHPGAIFSMVPKGFFSPAYIHRVRDLTNTHSMFIIFGKLENSDLAYDLTKANLCSVPTGLDLLNTDPLKGSLLLTAPGVRDGKDSAAARGVILMRPASWREAGQFLPHNGHGRLKGYQEWKEEQTKLLLERARRSWGNGCRITSLAAGSSLTFHNRLHAPYGTIYGVQHNLHQITATARTKLPGFLLSGQSTLITGIMGASLAGLVTAGEIIGLETLWNMVRSCR